MAKRRQWRYDGKWTTLKGEAMQMGGRLMATEMTLALLAVLSARGDRLPAAVAQEGRLGAIVYTKPDASGLLNVWTINPDGSGDHRIPVGLADAEAPVWSRDGRLIAATGEIPGAEGQDTNLFVFDPMGTHLQQVTHFVIQRDATGQVEDFVPYFKAFSPDGQRLAFVVDDLVREQLSLELSQLDGTGLTFLGVGPLDGYQGFGIDWSPAGDLLAVPISTVDWSSGTPADVTALFTAPPIANALQQGLARQITFPHSGLGMVVGDLGPVFSPDGKQVAFIRRSFQVGFVNGLMTCSLRVVNSDGSNEREVIPFPPGEVVSRVSWSGDGTELVFDRGQERIQSGSPAGIADPATTGLWIIHADGTGLNQLKAPPATSPSWSWAG